VALNWCLPRRERLIGFPEADVVTPDIRIDVAFRGFYPTARTAKAFLNMPDLAISLGYEETVRIAIDGGQ
jgi:hypothetical protein